jgi:Protein of unknown function (DUF1573)
MRRNSYANFLLALLIFIFGCNSEQKQARLFIPVTNIDLSEIKADSNYKLVYRLINTGNTTLVIDTVTTSCGCTTPVIQKRMVVPSDSTLLVIGFKPADTGLFNKKVVIKSNTDSSFTIVSFYGRAIK